MLNAQKHILKTQAQQTQKKSLKNDNMIMPNSKRKYPKSKIVTK